MADVICPSFQGDVRGGRGSLQTTTWISPFSEVVRHHLFSNYLAEYLRADVFKLHPPIESGLVASSEVGDDVISFPLQVRHMVGVESVGEGGEISEGGGSVGGG